MNSKIINDLMIILVYIIGMIVGFIIILYPNPNSIIYAVISGGFGVILVRTLINWRKDGNKKV